MANILKLTALIAVFFTLNFAHADNLNPTGSPDDELFDYAYGLAPAESQEMQWFCQVSGNNFWTASGDACVAAACTHLMDNVPDGKHYEACGVDTINLNGINLFVAYKYNSYTVQNGQHVFPQVRGGVLINSNGTLQTSQNCPPDGNNSYTLSAQVGQTPLCFNPIDIAARDTCYANGTTPEFLQQSGQGPSVCMTMDDGSQCKYDDQGDYYALNVESSCYEGNDPDYEEQAASTGDENNCHIVGSQTFCEANYEDTCPPDQNNISQCPTGCGFYDLGNGNAFGCFGENDNSGDPSTCEALGTCEEENPDNGGGDGVDTSGIEARIDETNSLLGEGNGTLDSIDGTLGNIEGINDDMRNGIGSVNDGIGNLAQIAVQTRDELRNESGVTFDDVEPSDSLEGFYTPAYEDGWNTVWQNNQEAWEQNPVKTYIASWEINVSGNYSLPEICFNLGIANFGCHQLTIDERFFPFIRIIFIFSALVLARQITLGG